MNASAKNLVALIIGGFGGAVLRFGVSEWIPYTATGFPWSTLWINWLGCLFLGWFLTVALGKMQVRPEVRLGLSTGFTGSFTTFSTFSVQAVHLIRIGHSGIAMSYITLSVIGGVLLSATGVWLANKQVKQSEPRRPSQEGA